MPDVDSADRRDLAPQGRAALAARVAELESALAEQGARANAEIAALQRRLYWLDRLEIDLDVTMSRPVVRVAVVLPIKAIRRLRHEQGRIRRRLRA